jgi:hypothetical protein
LPPATILQQRLSASNQALTPTIFRAVSGDEEGRRFKNQAPLYRPRRLDMNLRIPDRAALK